jgi:hypothetical protein
MDCECGAEGKGGGGSTAGGRRCRLLHGPSAEGLFLLLAMESRDCHDGRAQYSPRRGPFRFLSSMHGHPIHGRATPLSEGGRSLAPSLILAFAHWIAEEEAFGTHRRSVGEGIGQIGVCFVGRCPRPSLEPIQTQSSPIPGGSGFVRAVSAAWWGWPVGADLRAARHGPSFRTARPEVGPYRRELQDVRLRKNMDFPCALQAYGGEGTRRPTPENTRKNKLYAVLERPAVTARTKPGPPGMRGGRRHFRAPLRVERGHSTPFSRPLRRPKAPLP